MITVKKFSAEWCGPCKMLAPHFEKIKSEFPGVSFQDLDVENASYDTVKYEIQSVPTVIIEKSGKLVAKIVGAKPANVYSSEIKKHL